MNCVVFNNVEFPMLQVDRDHEGEASP
jgi:hypothetical protein